MLLISVDMLRADHLGSYGYGRETSPHLDRLAKEGVLFEDCISSAPWTLPTHAALFTGLPDSVHGCTDSDRALAPGFTTLAERFKQGGYATTGFFSGPYLHPAFGLGQGFDSYVNCTSYARAIDGQPAEDWAMDTEVMHSSHRDVTSPTVTEEVLGWLAGRGDGGNGQAEPFFMFVHLWDVHFDFLPPAPYDELFAGEYGGSVSGEDFFFDPAIHADMPAADREHLLDLYDGEIRWTDHHIGLILAALEERGLLENTVVALTADHGTEFFEHGGKAHRMTLFEEVLRVPLVLRYPAAIPAGTRVRSLARTVDIAPTLLELADLAPLAPAGGRSLLPAMQGGGDPGVAAVSELFSVGRAMRSVRTERWKFIDDMGRGTFAWYDLAADPRELHPSQDLTQGLGQEARDGYLEAMAELERLYAARPAAPAQAQVPAAVDAHLRALGYVGADEADGADGDDRAGGAGEK